MMKSLSLCTDQCPIVSPMLAARIQHELIHYLKQLRVLETRTTICFMRTLDNSGFGRMIRKCLLCWQFTVRKPLILSKMEKLMLLANSTVQSLP